LITLDLASKNSHRIMEDGIVANGESMTTM